MGENRYTAIDEILKGKAGSQREVIPILQAIQNEYHYLPEDILKRVCDQTEITSSQLMGVASFYSQFRLKPTGEHIIKVCTGTACHVKRAELVYDTFGRELHLGAGEDTDKKGNYTLEKVNCLGCCTLAPVVQIDDVTYGHVEVETVKRVLHSFENLHGHPKPKEIERNGAHKNSHGEIRIGLGSCCIASGSEDVKNSVELAVKEIALDVNMKRVGCVGMCHQVPLLEVIPKGKEPVLYAKVQPGDVKKIIHRHFKPQGIWQRMRSSIFNFVEDIQTDRNWEGIEQYELNVREKHVTSFLDRQVPIATEFRGAIDPLDIYEYKQGFGFKALTRCLKELSPDEIVSKIQESGLRGRGGAGFPTGAKWETFKIQKSNLKYIICNGDEGDPGAFMDRMLLESYPYRIIEGMIIAAYATGATRGYFYIRAEYPLAVKRIKEALKVSREQGYLGDNILESGLSFDIDIFEGAGAFICGEETALIASIEGNRGFPKLRPPYPVQQGLWDRPTLVNNTETFAQVPFILRNDIASYTRHGTDNSKGTKVFALAGKINRGGLIEVPMGITIREIVEEIGGGVSDGKKFKAVQIGGPSGGCVPEWMADTPVDFHSLKEVGAMMGSGGLVVLDETDCMVDIARYFLSFTQSESCGKCTFCRVGTRRMLDILNDITAGRGTSRDLDELEKLAKWTKKGSLCGLGQSAPNPVLSTLTYFREEYEAHINGKCPTGKCQNLIKYNIDNTCIGCTKCAQNCPVDAIAFTPFEVHVIDQEKCIKCDGCRQVCPEDSVRVE
jgi:NADH:ubiquinone oxidoreductase subunit F (NADH-binding)/NADH:ubiquinone oxidoreductase subunit E/NAD-dependent dihydropyrimidine dehydrogenase PreA subunit